MSTWPYFTHPPRELLWPQHLPGYPRGVEADRHAARQRDARDRTFADALRIEDPGFGRVIPAARREGDHVAAIFCSAARALRERRFVAVPALRILVDFVRAALVVVLDQPVERERLHVCRNALVI